MTDLTADFCILYALRRTDVLEVARSLDEALDEDHRQNADMFDISRTTFPKSRHPNFTMRALEEKLRNADISLLCLLSALTEAGLELTQGLADFSDTDDFAKTAADIYENLQKRDPSAGLLAQRLTEIKAEHARKRLLAAMEQMDRIGQTNSAL